MRHKPHNETRAQQDLRERRLEIQEWNQNFWAKHNKRFFEVRTSRCWILHRFLLILYRFQDKAEFIRLNKRPGQDTIPADDMSKFYKYFLDKNWKIHVLYNVSWYSKNFELLFLALHVNLEKVYRKVRGKQ